MNGGFSRMIEIKGNFVTFTPPKDAAYLIGDFTDWDEVLLPIHGSLTIEIPQGAYVEYAYLDTDKRPLIDVTNSEKPKNPWYSYHSSITLPQNQFQTPSRPRSFNSTVHEYSIESKSFGQNWTYSVYEPPTYPIATLYVHDGAAFYHKLHFHEVAYESAANMTTRCGLIPEIKTHIASSIPHAR
jgi:hypothetical protein